MLSKSELGQLYGACEVAISTFQGKLRRANKAVTNEDRRRELCQDYTARVMELTELQGRLTAEIDAAKD